MRLLNIQRGVDAAGTQGAGIRPVRHKATGLLGVAGRRPARPIC